MGQGLAVRGEEVQQARPVGGELAARRRAASVRRHGAPLQEKMEAGAGQDPVLPCRTGTPARSGAGFPTWSILRCSTPPTTRQRPPPGWKPASPRRATAHEHRSPHHDLERRRRRGPEQRHRGRRRHDDGTAPPPRRRSGSSPTAYASSSARPTERKRPGTGAPPRARAPSSRRGFVAPCASRRSREAPTSTSSMPRTATSTAATPRSSTTCSPPNRGPRPWKSCPCRHRASLPAMIRSATSRARSTGTANPMPIDPGTARAEGRDGRVHADDLAGQVHERSSGVAGVDRGVRLDDPLGGAAAAGSPRGPRR